MMLLAKNQTRAVPPPPDRPAAVEVLLAQEAPAAVVAHPLGEFPRSFRNSFPQLIC